MSKAKPKPAATLPLELPDPEPIPVDPPAVHVPALTAPVTAEVADQKPPAEATDPAPAATSSESPEVGKPPKPRREFTAATIKIVPKCPLCGGTNFKHLSSRPQNGGKGYDYHDPAKGYIGKMTRLIRAECAGQPGRSCGRAVIIKEITPPDSGEDDPDDEDDEENPEKSFPNPMA